MNHRTLTILLAVTFTFLPTLTFGADSIILKRGAGVAAVQIGTRAPYTLFKDATEIGVQFIDGKDTKVKTTTKTAILSEVSYVVSTKTTSTSTIPFQGCCGSTVIAYDLRSKGNLASLTNWFPESEIIRSLARDSWLAKHVKQLKSLDQLSESGTENPFVCRSALDHSFAFHHLNGDSIAVRLYLPNECFGESVQLGFYLPIPDSLKAAFAAASSQKKLIRQK